MKYSTTIGEHTFTIEINRDDEVLIDGEKQLLDLKLIDDLGTYSLLIDNHSYETLVEWREGELDVLVRGQVFTIKVKDERAQRLAAASGALDAPDGEIAIKSPMPGLIVAVNVAVDQEITKGEALIVLESMKMENELKAPRDGTVRAVKVEPQQTVEQGQVLVLIE